MSIASWLAGAPRRIKTTFAALVSTGKRSEKRAAQLIKIVEKAGVSEFKPVKGSKGARYFLPGAPKTAPTISRTEYITRKYGAGPKELAAERKTETPARGYVSEATRARAKKQIETRAKRAEQRAQPQYSQVPAHPTAYLNTDGVIAHDYFSGKHLVTMHQYRGAFEHAVHTGDGAGLRRFKTMTIITYDGPGLRGYDNKGVQIFPETNLKRILAKLNSMTVRERLRFNEARNYRHLQAAA